MSSLDRFRQGTPKLVLRKWGIGFNEGSSFSKYLPSVQINCPKGIYYFSIWYLDIRKFKRYG